ncbi:MAG: ECF-type biotin uptake system pemease component BioN [Saliniramus fredricksonii]|uniref:Biotin transport system permease protein n=1 Tax=Saliniramus fredricksonii TaxID=1653334 RepID=A0A0P7X8G7_9HYPH|nr:energy-coupling factor transporter transmembrane protein EcfT [Saliniramus fredricksonii]KPQ11449.1 MAG: ECF-type biotin uptake system pemease component BioN [Saliniramus fredricksonii]SCC82356.1 biotin transport system permease protein [Saliniramus fredricksonii]
MLGIYRHGTSPLHRARPGVKLAGLALMAIALFLPASPAGIVAVGLGAAFVTVAGYGIAGIPSRIAIAQIRPALWILGMIFLFHAIMGDALTGALIVARFILLIALAALVTLTTRVSDMIATIEAGLQPLRRFVDPGRIAMCLVLTIRFVPVLANEAHALQEAQAARGGKRTGPSAFIRLAVPLILRGLRLSETVAEALHARGFGRNESFPESAQTRRGHAKPGLAQPDSEIDPQTEAHRDP